MATLYLRAYEQELLEKLPADVASVCVVEEEGLAAYETPTELVVRMRLVASDVHPEVREFVLGILEKLQKGEDLDPKIFATLPHESLPIVYFGMGAIGLCALVEALFPEVKTGEDLEGLAGLTKMRHLLLEANASVTV